ncbi:MAG: UDP-glucose 4-epimerase [Oceanicoccus sp.]
MTKRILLTGSTGFIGSVITVQFKSSDYQLCPVVRYLKDDSPLNAIEVGDIDGNTDYNGALSDVDVVIHVAARAHMMSDESSDPLAEYRKVNVEGSENLARQAAAAGVKRFVFISSVKVSGESTTAKSPYSELMKPAPEDAYGQSKYEAEEVLKQVAADTGMEVVIIRPPLVYGAGVKANFLSLLKLSTLSIPLPFGTVNNKRSMVYVGSLVDFIIRCIDHPNAANQTFLVSDGEDLSLKSLITYIRKAMGKSPLLLPVPVGLFKLAGKLTGKSGVVDRLVGNLQVDSSKARELLDWTPPYTVEQGIAATVLDFNNRKN